MSHIVNSCPLTKFEGGLLRLHEADEAAVDWLTTYGSQHTIIIIRPHYFCPSPDFTTLIVSQSVTNSRCAPSCEGHKRKVRGHLKKFSAGALRWYCATPLANCFRCHCPCIIVFFYIFNGMIFFYLQRPITDDLFHQLANHSAFCRSGNYIFTSKLTFSINLFHHSLLAPIWTAFSDYTGPDLLCSTVFLSFFILGRAVD